MSAPPTRDPLILAVLGVGLASVCGLTIVGVLHELPDAQMGTALPLVIGFLGTMLAALTNTALGSRANQKLDRVLNGEMDAKIEAAVTRVLVAQSLIPDPGPEHTSPPRPHAKKRTTVKKPKATS